MSKHAFSSCTQQAPERLAHLALLRANLKPGETVLVTAAAGGVGLAAVELAKKMGAGRVVAACG